ncbi:MAG: sugar ABC transporter permease [Spirochaetia bacterium]
MKAYHHEGRVAAVLLFPAAAALFVFYYYPIAQSAIYSVYDLRYTTDWLEAPFVGFGNYAVALTQPEFWSAFRFTALFTVGAVFLDFWIGMIFAAATFWVHRRMRALLRAIIIIPWAIPNVIQASIWRWLLDTDVGLIGDLMVRSGLVESPPLFLSNQALAMISVVWAYVWKGSAISAIFLMAGLATVPHELHESARIDGAGPLRRFFSVTFPVILPTIFVTLLFRTRDALRVFDMIFGLTQGGPGNATETLSTFTYKVYFSFNRYGEGSAYAIITFLVIFAVSAVYLRQVSHRFHARA